MKNSITMQEFDSYAYELINYLKECGYCEVRIKVYKRGIKKLKYYLEKNNIRDFNMDSLEGYNDHFVQEKEYKKLLRKEKDEIRVANVLLEYSMTNNISFRSKRRKVQFDGVVGVIMIEYFNMRREKKISERTIDNDKLYLSRFNEFLLATDICDVKLVTIEVLNNFINSLNQYTASTRHCTLRSLKGFTRFLYLCHYLENDLSIFIAKDNYKKHAKLPTTYTQDEIERLISAIDRGNPKGKRDYAIILLAARLGLRSSDICNLKFENIIWDENKIKIIQRKTGKAIQLPLLSEIGNGIIDYLKYGRPVSESEFLFLHANHKYDQLKPPTIHSIVTQYLRIAKIDNYSNKKHGPHALRHSLARLLLENKTALPIISEVLGHSNTESTKTYLSIDIHTLSDCALDVPPLNTNFYGGDNK